MTRPRLPAPAPPDSVAPASYYCEIHIYVTSKPKTDTPKEPLKRSSKVYSEAFRRPVFTAQQLYDEMLVPTVKAKNQRKAMKEAESPNRFQDVWIWDGRPEWDEIFSDIKENREHRDIGVCFCGMALICDDYFSEPCTSLLCPCPVRASL